MIYEVYLDGELLYYPNDETYVIINSCLQLALNEAGSIEFDVPTYNLRYNDFKLRKSMIQVLQNGEEIFYGEVREVKTNPDFTKHIYAVGELAFLFDSIQPQARYLTSPYDAMKQIIAKHNSQVENRKKYILNEVSATDKDNQIYFYTNGEDTLSIIREKICNTVDGYIRITKKNNDRYISIVPLSRFGTCTQEIQFGENLLDYSCNMSATDIATCVIPRGAKLEDDERTDRAVEGLDEYLTIVGTTADYYHKNDSYDYVQLDEAIERFGYVRVMKTWDNVTIAENLKTKAIEWLKTAQYEAMTLELKALDMSQFDVNIDTMKLGEEVHVWALPYGMDASYPVRKKTIYLQDLEKNQITLGNTSRTSYTDQSSKAIEQLKEELPEESIILKQAKENAVAMLSDPSKGYVSYIFDEDGNRTAIEITNSKDSTKATKKWVWNSSGLGYMYKENGIWKTNVAMTIEGAITADFITAGIMSGDRIRGGELLIGGDKYAQEGKIIVQNEKGTELIRLDKNGITLSNGQTISYSNISNTPTIPTKTSQLTNDSGFKTVITANDITTGTMSADRIQGGELTIGGSKDGYKDGKITVYDSNNKVIAQFNGDKHVSQIASFTITNNSIVNANSAIFSGDKIGCGEAGKGVVFIRGNKSGDNAKYGQIAIANDADTDGDIKDGIKIYGNGHVIKYNGEGTQVWDRWLSNIPTGE